MRICILQGRFGNDFVLLSDCSRIVMNILPSTSSLQVALTEEMLTFWEHEARLVMNMTNKD